MFNGSKRRDFKTLEDALRVHPIISLNLSHNDRDAVAVCRYLDKKADSVFIGSSIEQLGFCSQEKQRSELCVYAGIRNASKENLNFKRLCSTFSFWLTWILGRQRPSSLVDIMPYQKHVENKNI